MENERFRGLALLPAAGLVVVMGCTAGGAEMAIDELHEFGSGYTAAWNSRNLVSVAALYREDGSLQVNDPEPSVGPEAIAERAPTTDPGGPRSEPVQGLRTGGL